MDVVVLANVTANASRNASTGAIQEGTAALIIAIEHAGRSGMLTDVALLVALGAFLLCGCCVRPRLMSIVAASWLAWFGFRLAKGQVAWHEITGHAQHARKATEIAATALFNMFVSWCVLVAPALLDLQQLVAPVTRGLWQAAVEVWEQMSWKDRGIVALSFLAIASSVMAVRALVRHQDTVKDVLFQLSFAICGPMIWWLTSHMPHKYSILLVLVVMSLVPSLASMWVFMCAQWEKENKTDNDARSSWFAALDSVDAPMAESVTDELQAKMHLWLSYWACWPFFHLSYIVISSANFVDKEDMSAVDGLFVALILWAQFWRASRIAPYAFALSAVLLRSFTEGVGQAIDSAGSKAVGKVGQLYLWLSERATDAWMFYLGAAVAVIIVTAVLLKVVEIAEAFVTLAMFFGAAFDSARCVARNASDMYAARLAFWIIATAWMKVREIPLLGGSLIVWTPLVLVAALAAGETVLNTIIWMITLCVFRCRGASQANTPNPKYHEVETGEDARKIDPLQLRQTDVGDGI